MRTPQSPRRSGFVIGLAMVVCLPVRAESGSVDGNLQPVFTSWTLPAYPLAICPSDRGGMAVSGAFNIVNGQPIGAVADLGSDGRLDSEFQVPVLPWTISATAAALPDGRLLIRANRLLSVTPDGLPDGLVSYSYCTPDVCGTLALVAVQQDGSVFAIGSGLPLGAGTSPVVRFSVDGRTVEGAVSLPPLPGGLGANSVRGLVFDQRERLYLTPQLDLGTCAAYRLTSDREWDRGFVVTGQGNVVTSALSHDGDWLYVAGATEVKGMHSGGLVRVSTLARPRIEIVGSSPFFGTDLLLAGEAGRRHRGETSRDLRTWEAFVDLTLGEQPEWLTDWIGWGEPYRLYRLSLIAESLRAESDVAGPELDR